MSRVILNSLNKLRIFQTSQKTPCIQCIRSYRPRKPFWLPIGKTKMFRIPKQTEIPEDEKIELSRLYNVYRTNMKSLRQYFKEQLIAQTTGQEVIEEQKKKLAEEHALCVKENDVWNAEVAKIREQRLAKEALDKERKVLQKIMDCEKKQQVWMEQIDSHIRSEKENAKTFITAANIDKAIDDALVDLVDHNFCIDKDENVYLGRYGKPTPKPKLENAPLKQQEEEQTVEARI